MTDLKGTVTFRTESGDLYRKLEVRFDSSLLDVALLLLSSLVRKKDLPLFHFRLAFGDEDYVTRKDEQNDLYGYSTTKYHVLDDESLQNAALRNSGPGLFILYRLDRPEDVVLTMALDDVGPATEKEKPRLMDGAGLLRDDYTVEKASFSDISRNVADTMKDLRKTYVRPRVRI